MNLIISNQAISTYNGLFSLNDLHKVSGGEPKHKPTNFMRNAEVQELIAEIEQGSNLRLEQKSVAYETIHGGTKNGTYVCRELVYRYAMWISAKFSLMVIRAFDALNTGAIPALAHHTISVEQQAQIRHAIAKRCKSNREHYQSVYTALHQEFNIPRYSELLAVDFERAMAFIQSYQLGNADLYNVLADSAVHTLDYMRLLKSLKGLPIIDEQLAHNTFINLRDSLKDMANLATQLDLRNRHGKPMFEQGKINYFSGSTLIYR